MASDAELLALLEQKPARLSDPEGELLCERDIVEAFVRDNELRRGKVPTLEACDLYRWYLQWAEIAFPDYLPLKPMAFCHQFKALKFRQIRTPGTRLRFYRMRKECFLRAQAWLAANPSPEGARAGFRQFFKPDKEKP